MNEFYIRNVVEAALLAAGKPMQLAELGQLFDESARPKVEDLQAALTALAAEYENRGLEVKETAAGFRIQVRKEFAAEISRLWPERPAKYSRALLETLALIAYRQPITRAEIEAVRGVAVNPNIVKTVIERNWVRVVGHRDVPGRPELLGTTREFLDYFGLRSLDELPPLADVKAMGDYNLQLELPNGAAAADGKGEGAPVALLTDGAVAAEGAAPADTVVEGTVAAVEGAAGEGAVAAVEGTVPAVEGAAGEGAVAAVEGAAVEGTVPAVEGAAVEGAVAAVEGGIVESAVAAEGLTAGEATSDVEGVGSAGSVGSAEAVVLAEGATSAEDSTPVEPASTGDSESVEAAGVEVVVQVETVEVESVLAEGDAEAEPTHFQSSTASESVDALDDASDDDADEDELSADGHGSRELVAAPPRDGDH